MTRFRAIKRELIYLGQDFIVFKNTVGWCGSCGGVGACGGGQSPRVLSFRYFLYSPLVSSLLYYSIRPHQSRYVGWLPIGVHYPKRCQKLSRVASRARGLTAARYFRPLPVIA